MIRKRIKKEVCPAKLYLGDCLSVMPRKVADHSIDAIITDLPFATTQNKWDILIPFEPLWTEYRRVIKPRGVIVLFASQPFSSMLVMSNKEMFKYEWVWSKNSTSGFLNALKRPLVSHEVVLIFSPNVPPYYPQGVKPVSGKHKYTGPNDSTETYGKTKEGYTKIYGEGYPWSVIPFDCERTGAHTTQKPVALMEYLVRTYTREGETVLDSTMGSGTTGLGAIRAGRNFVGIEKDEGIFNTASVRIRTMEKIGIVVPRVEEASGFWRSV